MFMKKSVLAFTGLVSTLVLAGVSGNTVQAAGEGTDTVNTTATFNVTNDKAANQTADLAILQAPALNFGEIGLSKVIADPNTLTDSGPESPLEVSDLTGTSNGWDVTVNLSSFTNGDDTIDDAVVAVTFGELTGDNIVDDGVSIPSVTGLTSDGTTSATVQSAKPGYGQGDTQTPFTNATLELPQHAQAKEGTYSATLTWTAASPAAPADSAQGDGTI